MTSQFTLLLVCTLFAKALSLTCTQCLPSATGNCTSGQTTCKTQCLTATTAVYSSGIKLTDYYVQTCGDPNLCVNGSMNMGQVKFTVNAKCCSTDLCNSVKLPVPPKQAPNGMMCYTCDATSCSGTVQCEGDENSCISASVKLGSNTVPMKGCMSSSACVSSASTSRSGIGISNLKCCQGNLCNGAESVTLSLILMITPLLSSILFH